MPILQKRQVPRHPANSVASAFTAVSAGGSFEGYASLFNLQDMGRDVVAPGAFAESLARRGARGIKMLFQHDANQPIGVWDTIREDSRGLYVTGRLIPEVTKAREVLAMMRAGAIDGLSIGFRTLAGKRDRGSRRAPPRQDRPVGDLHRDVSDVAGGARHRRKGPAAREGVAGSCRGRAWRRGATPRRPHPLVRASHRDLVRRPMKEGEKLRIPFLGRVNRARNANPSGHPLARPADPALGQV